MSQVFKFGGSLIINLTIAVIGTAILNVPIRHAIPPHSIVALVWQESLFSIVCATGFGFSVWRSWSNPAAKWTWVLPTAWFAFGFLVVAGHDPVFGRLFAPHSESVLYGPDARSFVRSFYAFTVPMIRGVSYS
jgi:hypothetical protein